jgi:hypothetical protein
MSNKACEGMRLEVLCDDIPRCEAARVHAIGAEPAEFWPTWLTRAPTWSAIQWGSSRAAVSTQLGTSRISNGPPAD